MPATDPLLITDLLASPNAEPGGNVDYQGVGSAASDLEYALSELDECAPRYREAQLYAAGRSPELFFLSDQARRDVVAMIDGFRLNFAGLVPATIADRMMVNGIDGIRPIEEIVFDSNSFYTWAPEAILDTLIDGDHYVITLDGDNGPVMIPSNAVDTRLFYDSETERIPEMGIRRWAVGRGRETAVRANLWYPDRVERFIRRADEQWQRYSSDTLADVEPMEFIPFAHLRTRAPYGRPIHADAYGPQDMIVKGVMTLMASVEFAGWPQRYALHEEAMIGQTGMPKPNNLPDGTQSKSRLRGGPGTVWDVFAKQVGAFPAADLDKLIDTVAFAVKAMSQTTRIPMHYFDPLGAGSSGESRIAADQPVKASASKQKGNLGRGFADATDHVAAYVGATVDPEVIWAPDPIISDKTWWETATMKSQHGVPDERILQEAGYTPEEIEEFMLIREQNKPDIPVVDPTTVQDEPVEEIPTEENK